MAASLLFCLYHEPQSPAIGSLAFWNISPISINYVAGAAAADSAIERIGPIWVVGICLTIPPNLISYLPDVVYRKVVATHTPVKSFWPDLTPDTQQSACVF